MKTHLFIVTGLLLTQTVFAQAEDRSLSEIRQKAVQFLEVTQNPDGSWTKPEMVGITGLVTASLLQSGVPADHPMVANGLKNLLAQQQPSGGFHTKDSLQKNYETCITVFALSAANQDGRYNEQISRAEKFLRGLQWDQGEGIESSHPAWGGGGYGSHQRPDMSNTQYLIEALKAAGVKEDDEAMQKILVFVSRTQNLEGHGNDTRFAGLINDGGFYYTPAAGGDSKAGTTENGGLRSYGSMTYAGVKSLIYAGLKKDDERVAMALQWIRKHYTLQENPGMGQQGLYYYFHTFGKTMTALGDDAFADEAGQVHDWRAELKQRVASLQQENGSWVNPADRWYEGDPNLVTAYCLMALSYCD
ncbi:MAG: prenyltransferase/squalene oxidase repeat-containing protein [Planctomycetaceae bacterium]